MMLSFWYVIVFEQTNNFDEGSFLIWAFEIGLLASTRVGLLALCIWSYSWWLVLWFLPFLRHHERKKTEQQRKKQCGWSLRERNLRDWLERERKSVGVLTGRENKNDKLCFFFFPNHVRVNSSFFLNNLLLILGHLFWVITIHPPYKNFVLEIYIPVIRRGRRTVPVSVTRVTILQSSLKVKHFLFQKLNCLFFT